MQFEIHFRMKKFTKTNFKFLTISLALISLISLPVFIGTTFGVDDDKIVILHTNSGPLIIEFFPDDAPNTVKNFLELVESGFYDNTLFHRIIKDFMIQGGDPLTKYGDDGFTNVTRWGTGDPGYEIKAEFNDIKHNRGIVSMARSLDPDSAGSQFFIVHHNSFHLDGQYTVFGRLLNEESYTTLDKIANIGTTNRDIPNDFSLATITKAEIITRADVENSSDSSIDIARTPETEVISPTDYRFHVNQKYNFSIISPEGWSVIYPQPDSSLNDPIITFSAPVEYSSGAGTFPPFIYVNVNELDGKTFQEFLDPRVNEYHRMNELDNDSLIIEREDIVNFITEDERKFNSYIIIAKQKSVGGWVKFAQTLFHYGDYAYGFTYANHEEDFENHIEFYHEVINSFKILEGVSEKATLSEKAVVVQKETQLESGTPSTTSTSEVERKIVCEGDVCAWKEVEKSEPGLIGEGGGCLIATAAFGSELAPQIQFLREIRDNTILQTESGYTFMTTFNQFYYSFSPAIADYERENPVFKEVVKLTLTPLLTSLTLLQYADIDTEPEMLGYGIGIILMNIGMYFVAPAVLIVKVRNFYKLQ